MYESRLQSYRDAFPEFDDKKQKMRLANVTLDDWITTIKSSIKYMILLKEKDFESVQMRRVNTDFVKVCGSVRLN